MNAPGSLLVAKALMPETEKSVASVNVLKVRDTESKNLIDAIGTGAMSGGKIAVIVGCLLIAFIALIGMVSAVLGWFGGLFGFEGWSLEGLFGIIFARSRGRWACPGTTPPWSATSSARRPFSTSSWATPHSVRRSPTWIPSPC
nr:nucleoside transporter C-terminal domain-containing protein [Kocuria atrinae]